MEQPGRESDSRWGDGTRWGFKLNTGDGTDLVQVAPWRICLLLSLHVYWQPGLYMGVEKNQGSRRAVKNPVNSMSMKPPFDPGWNTAAEVVKGKAGKIEPSLLPSPCWPHHSCHCLLIISGFSFINYLFLSSVTQMVFAGFSTDNAVHLGAFARAPDYRLAVILFLFKVLGIKEITGLIKWMYFER